MSLEDKIDHLIIAIERLTKSLDKLSVHRTAEMCTDKLIPLAKWHEVHEFPRTSALRNIVYNKQWNGADAFVVKLGRRVYIDQDKFFEWMKSKPNLNFTPKPK